MRFGMQEKFQLGQTGWLVGDWPNILAGALELEAWFCTNCGYIAQGPDAPEYCPVCGYPTGYFIRYDRD